MKNEKISKDELVKKVINLGLKLNRTPMKRDDNSLNYHAKKLFGSWNNLMKSADYPVKFYQKINKTELTEGLAYFLGLLITDGHIYYNINLKKYKVAIYTSYTEERDMILKLIKKLFNYNAGVSSRMYGFNKKPNYEIRISSKNLAECIMGDFNIPSGAKSLIIMVPEKIKKSNIQIKRAFLRGVIDGDGSILKDNIKITSSSINFLHGIKELLVKAGICCGKVTKHSNKTNTFSLVINKQKNLLGIKEIYKSEYYYKRKKMIIDKV